MVMLQKSKHLIRPRDTIACHQKSIYHNHDTQSRKRHILNINGLKPNLTFVRLAYLILKFCIKKIFIIISRDSHQLQ